MKTKKKTNTQRRIPEPPRLPDDIPLPTRQQRAAIQAIDRLWQRLGRSPSLSEIGEELGISKKGADTLMRTCRRRGFVGSRRIVVELELTPEGKRWV